MMRTFPFILLFLIFFCSFISDKEVFKNSQLKNHRVAAAYKGKYGGIQKLYADKKIDITSHKIFLRAFKKEGELELWASNSSGIYQFIKTFKFCYASGNLGPKRKYGDYQVPEGFYYIDRFNPCSAFYLSLGINYPNQSDRILSPFSNLGGDIFIHGDCVSIGCISINDDQIKELYIAAVEAKTSGQTKIPVHIFPCKLTTEKFKIIKGNAKDNRTLDFWQNLKEGYEFFEASKELPQIKIDCRGKYLFCRQ